MRIGIDARELCGQPTGVGRHLAGLLGGWGASAAAGRHTLLLYSHQTPATALPPNATLRVIPGAGGTPWEQLALPRAAKGDRLDVFFAPGYTAPLTLQAPIVVLVHDLSFVSHPEWFRTREGLRRRLFTRWASQRATRVLTVSESARGEIVAQFGLPPDRVLCIHPGIATIRSAETAGEHREPLIAFVGSIFNRRHVPDLIGAFRHVARAHPAVRLEIVGDNRTYPNEDLQSVASRHGIQAEVAIRSYIPDDALADLYQRASAFAFLSEYEGFGHPPLEALACGVPGVLLDTPVARETCGEAALYVQKGDLDATAAALTRLLFDRDTRARILAMAPSVLGRYSWARTAQQTLDALESAARSAA
jgi:glycosyltransferase involved in cell wall biosynthesis